MITAQFSEFSYGFAITDNFLHSGVPHTGEAPTFPSLMLVSRRSEQMPPGFWPPYLRMHLRTKRPNQHRLLLNWEERGHLVYYTTPDFWRTGDLDQNFSNRAVHNKSWYVKPSQIGPLDERAHHLAYEEKKNEFWLCSQPVRLNGHFGSGDFSREVQSAVERARPQSALSFLHRLASDIADLTRTRVPELPHPTEEEIHAQNFDAKELSAEEAERRRRHIEARFVVHAAREVAYMSQVRLGCAFAIVGKD
jgi:hypothetical protein